MFVHYPAEAIQMFENKSPQLYIINEQTHKAILISFGSKKEQQQIINHIIINKEKYLSLIR